MYKKAMAAIGLQSTVGLPTEDNKKPKAQTSSYSGRKYFQATRDLPLFTFDIIRQMLQDPEIRLGLAMRAAPLGAIEFAYIDGTDSQGKPKWCPGIEAKDPLVAAWVLRQLQTIWFQYLPGIAASQKWGWSGGEVTLRLDEDTGMIEINELLPRHSRDVRLLELPCGTRWGIQVDGVKEGASKVDLQYPYCYFINFRPEDGEKYSASILLGAYSPWSDQWLNGGALDVRRLFMHKDAYAGASIGYPEEDVYVSGSAAPIPAKQIADQIVEQSQSGNVITYPSSYDESGRPKWIIERAQVSANPQHILEYPKDLDIEKRHGLEIPDGAISNDGSGAWEGKSLPMAAFYAGLDTWVTQIFVDLMPTLMAIAQLNFGEDVTFKLRHKPLALTMLQQQGEKQQPGMQDATGGDPYGGDPNGGMPQPQMMSLNPTEAVGRGVLSATSIVAAARRALKLNQRIEYNSRYSRIQRMKAGPRHAPKGYTKDNPLIINGHEYVGGNFIPGDQLDHASHEQLKEIEAGVKSENSTPILPQGKKKESDDVPFEVNPALHAKHSQTLQTARSLKLKDGSSVKIQYDAKRQTEGYRVTHKDASGKTDYEQRFPTLKGAADFAAKELQRKRATVQSRQLPDKLVGNEPKSRKAPDEGNFHYESTKFYATGKKAKFRDNIAAIHTLQLLEKEQRPATDEEKTVLSKYVGWGQFPQAFGHYDATEPGERVGAWTREANELKALLNDEEYAAAKAATINSHYTNPDVIAAHWKMAERLGFKGGRYLEPAVGSGYYVGLMPKHLSANTHTTAIEMEKTSGSITKALYPSANVQITPLQLHPTPDDFYDLVATNVPFANFTIADPKYKRLKPNLHDYYFLRSIDTAKPGALIMHITSDGTMDKLDKKVRAKIESQCELVSAIRFPGDTHKANAGTEVVTDMIIMRKKNHSIPPVTDETPPEAMPPKQVENMPMTNDEIMRQRDGETIASQKQPGFSGTTVDSLGRLYYWKDGVRIPGPKWDTTVDIPDPDGGEPIRVNQYFADNPDQVLGRQDRSGTMYAGKSKGVSKEDDYEEQLQAAIDRLPRDIVRTEKKQTGGGGGRPENTDPERREATEKLKNGQLVIQDGKVFEHNGGSLVEMQMRAGELERLKGMIDIRDKGRAVIDAQRKGLDVTEARAALNEAYDTFVAKHGILHDDANRRTMRKDPDGSFLASLERFNSKTKEATKADIFTKDTVKLDSREDSAHDATHAVGIALNETGKIDIDRIAGLMGKDIEATAKELVDLNLAFQSPGGQWVSASEYLSGNTRAKLREARTAAAADPAYEVNVKALEGAQPERIEAEDIGFKLSSPWMPVSFIKEFSAHTIGGYYVRPEHFDIQYLPELNEWSVEVDRMASTRDTFKKLWGVEGGAKRVEFDDILRAALTNKAIIVRADKLDGESVGRVMQDKTDDANAKVDELKAQFKDWILTDDDRRNSLTDIYNESQNDLVERQHDGSHLTYPGMAADFEMRDIQNDAVMRIISTGKGLLGHEVGTGKTATMVAAASELRRLGLAKKPAIVVKNANIKQVVKAAQELYPDARIISTGESFDKEDRQDTLNRITTGDYDMVIMTHEHLAAFKMRPENTAKFIREELDELTEAVEQAEARSVAAGETKSSVAIVKRLEKRKQALEEKLRASLAEHKKDEVYFEDSGIDQIFVDEAHKFKTLPVTTSFGQIKGIPSGRSAERAVNMLHMTRWLQDTHEGRGVVFATGTPIANTMVELYNMQRYLQYDTLKGKGLHRFDNWANTFGEITNRLEYKLDGNVLPTARFNEFVNLPELKHLASEFMDIQRVDNLTRGIDQVPKEAKPPSADFTGVTQDAKGFDYKWTDGRTPAIIRPDKVDHVIVAAETPSVRAFMDGIRRRAEALKGSGPAQKGEDNMLSVCTAAKMGSIDQRLVDPDAIDDPDSKANRAVAQILATYHDPAKAKQTQAVFTDLGVNATKATGFDLFADIKQKLIAGGIPANEIADFSHMTDKQKEAAQDQLKRGDMRIAMGSTETLGTGTNIQHNLTAIHHLDIPYVPAAIEQREGRGYRSGNRNKKVDIFKYVQEGSADNVFWQIVASKANFIQQYMLGKKLRNMKELDTDTLSPDEMISVATGDKTMLERMELENDVRQLTRARNRHVAERGAMREKIDHSDNIGDTLRERIRDHERDMVHYKDSPFGVTIDPISRWDEPDETVHTVKAEAERKIHEKIQNFGQASSGSIGTYRGMPLHLENNRMVLYGKSGQKYDVYGQSLASIEAAAKRIEGEHVFAIASLKKHEAEVAKLKEMVGMPFRHDETLSAKIQKLEQLKNQHQRQLAERH
jgi:N12 class adenine-specific DNA methylase